MRKVENKSVTDLYQYVFTKTFVKLMKKNKISRRELARASGYSIDGIHKQIQKRRIYPRTIVAFCKMMKCQPKYITDLVDAEFE